MYSFHKNFLYHDIYKKFLTSKKIYNSITSILGQDLCHLEDPALTLNVVKKNTPKKNYLFKEWHQEFWSGASTGTLTIWSPIFSPKNKTGGLEVIPGSHLWGHVPHKNRMPLSLPKKFSTKKICLSQGDAIIFHSLLLHRSLQIESKKFDARLAFVTHIKNYKNLDNSFEINKSWKIFSLSTLSKIEKILGNHHLSPFRLFKNEICL